MEKRRSLLFVTNSELGQTSVVLAVAYEFLLRPEYGAHIKVLPTSDSKIDLPFFVDFQMDRMGLISWVVAQQDQKCCAFYMPVDDYRVGIELPK